MKTERQLSQADLELFRLTVGTVTPLKNRPNVPDTKKPLPRLRKQTKEERKGQPDRLSDHYQPIEHGDEQLSFARSGLQKATLKKLKKGHYRIEERLDLHGYRRQEARQILQEFLHYAHKNSYRCLILIHGKGRSSKEHGPILKPLVASWLQQSEEVLAYCTARQKDGGAGALYLLLRRPNQEW
ncbi:MAG: Smr/MutS family protein [Gammaproteobacteria bacterium]|nr:Smr/MutS family protein [Gammaproteobacteria bacterium]